MQRERREKVSLRSAFGVEFEANFQWEVIMVCRQSPATTFSSLCLCSSPNGQRELLLLSSHFCPLLPLIFSSLSRAAVSIQQQTWKARLFLLARQLVAFILTQKEAPKWHPVLLQAPISPFRHLGAPIRQLSVWVAFKLRRKGRRRGRNGGPRASCFKQCSTPTGALSTSTLARVSKKPSSLRFAKLASARP